MLSESWATRRDVSNNALRVIKFDEWIRNLIELQVTLKNALNYSASDRGRFTARDALVLRN